MQVKLQAKKLLAEAKVWNLQAPGFQHSFQGFHAPFILFSRSRQHQHVLVQVGRSPGGFFLIKIPSPPGRGGSSCQLMQWSIWVLFLHTLHKWSFSLFKSLGSEAFPILALSLYISFSRRSWQAFVSCSISRAFWSSGLSREAKQNYCTDAKAAKGNEPQVNGDKFNTWCFFFQVLQVYTYLIFFSWVDMERYFGMWSGWSHGLV